MEKIHVIFPGTEPEHPASSPRKGDPHEIRRIDRERQKHAEERDRVAIREIANSCGGSVAREVPSGRDYYSNFSNHGEIRGQEVYPVRRNGPRVWQSMTKPHRGGRNQLCFEMEVPSADQVVHCARYGMRIILLHPQRQEGTRLLPSVDSGASLQ